MYLAELLESDGIISGKHSNKCSQIQQDGRKFRYCVYSDDIEIVVTQNDVRAIQLAKAALYAGARLLMDKMNIDTPDKIILAGAFGSHINVKYAMILGMIPDCDIKNVMAAGNAAGTGARIALLNKNARAEIETVVRKIEKVEIATEPLFQQHFIEAMAIPHQYAPMLNLKAITKLPGDKIRHNLSSKKSRRTRKQKHRINP